MTSRRPVLGRLRWDARNHQFVARVRIGSETVRVHVVESAVTDRESARARISTLSERIEALAARVVRVAAAKLLAEARGYAEHAGRARVTQRDLRGALRLEKAYLEPSGSLFLQFDDGGLFWGHAVHATLDAGGKVDRVWL